MWVSAHIYMCVVNIINTKRNEHHEATILKCYIKPKGSYTS